MVLKIITIFENQLDHVVSAFSYCLSTFLYPQNLAVSAAAAAADYEFLAQPLLSMEAKTMFKTPLQREASSATAQAQPV